MSRKKKTIKVVVLTLVAIVIVVLNIPFFKMVARDGGSKIYYPLLPLWCYVEYHQLPERYPPHSTGNDAEKPDLSSYPLEVGGHGLILFGAVRVDFDKYEVYRDGHKEKISGFNLGLG